MATQGAELDEARVEFRRRLDGQIPDELNTDFNLDRWLRNYTYDVNACEEKFREYLANRRALGYDRPDALDNFYERPDVRAYCQMFSLSRLDAAWVNTHDNGLVFVETGVPDPAKVVRSIRVGDYLAVFFGYCEYFQRMVIEHERRTGRPSHGVCIFDMKFMSMTAYANPMSAINKLFQYRVNLWLEYYGELLKRVVIANPPRFLGAVFKIMSLIMPDRVLNRFTFASNAPADMEKYISRDAIPGEYGGDKRFEAPFMGNGCLKPTEVTKDDYLADGAVWKENDIVNVSYATHAVNAGEYHVQEVAIKRGQRFLYEFSGNRDLQFTIHKNKREYAVPRFKMATPVLSEEGVVVAEEDCLLTLEIRNLSKMMKMKLRLATLLVNNDRQLG